MNMSKNKLTLAAVSVMGALSLGMPTKDAEAANWLMLQGTEAPGAVGRAKVWGFIQPTAQYDNSDEAEAGPNKGNLFPPKAIPPNLDSQFAFNVNRARIGVRGQGFPLDNKINYFLLTEFGNNGITVSNKSFAKMTDASITLNHIPQARLRLGLFKYPGAEEGLQAIHVFDYINFTTVTNQMLLERFPERGYAGNKTPNDLAMGDMSGFTRSVGAFRDVGGQVFGVFDAGGMETSYAVMAGNGNGLNFNDDNRKKDIYVYLSTEKVFGGKGGRREGAKFWVWHQNGHRTLDNTNDDTYNPEVYKRTRTGFGAKYLKKPYRATFEYMMGEGMIFQGPDKPTYQIINGAGKVLADGPDSEASGFYLDLGYYIPKTKWEVDLRYDVYDRSKDEKAEMNFTTITAGLQYHLNKKTRVAFNYENRTFDAVNFDENAGPNGNLSTVGDRFAAQITAIY